jgi:hypothetical protein
MTQMTNTTISSEIDLEIVQEIKRNRKSTQYKNVYPDYILLEIQDLRENHGLSISKVSNHIYKKYDLKPSRSYISQIKKFLEKRFPKKRF